MFTCMECKQKKRNDKKSYGQWDKEANDIGYVCRDCVQDTKWHGFLNHQCGIGCEIYRKRRKIMCKVCGTPLGKIDWKKAGLKPTDEVRCNNCAMKELSA